MESKDKKSAENNTREAPETSRVSWKTVWLSVFLSLLCTVFLSGIKKRFFPESYIIYTVDIGKINSFIKNYVRYLAKNKEFNQVSIARLFQAVEDSIDDVYRNLKKDNRQKVLLFSKGVIVRGVGSERDVTSYVLRDLQSRLGVGQFFSSKSPVQFFQKKEKQPGEGFSFFNR